MSDKISKWEPVFVIGLTILAIQMIWFAVRLTPGLYESQFIQIISLVTSLAIPVICIYFANNAKQRSILIAVAFVIVLMRLGESWIL